MHVLRLPLRVALGALLGLASLPGSPALAQDRVVHDTLGPDLPTAVTCGFCAGERFGVVFRELPAPRRGISSTDFPLTIRSVQIAVASATVSAGPRCAPSSAGGVATAPVEVYAGEEPPTGSIAALPVDGAWSATEELVWAADAPLQLSAASADGTGYEVQFNTLELADEEGMPIQVDTGRYVRVVVTLPSSGEACVAGAGESPAGFPLRDGDGVIATERSYIYASSLGWQWNEEVGVAGDWGIRLDVTRTINRPDGGVPTDGGTGAPDAAVATNDAGATDAGAAVDAGVEVAGGGCSVGVGRGPGMLVGWLAVLVGLARRKRGP